LLNELIENIPALQAKEDLRLAEIVGTFTRTTDKKGAGKLKSAWRKFVNRRKRIIMHSRYTVKKDERRERINFDDMLEDEKSEFIQWLNSQGIKHG